MKMRLTCSHSPMFAAFRSRRGFVFALALALVLLTPPGWAMQTQAPDARPRVLRIAVHDTLQQERAHVFARAVDAANREGYSAILVDLSTPGGLSDSADIMVDAIHASHIPVIVWASSPQTRVSGQGIRLLAAADVSLMRPGAFLTPLWTDRVHGYPPARRATLSAALHRQLLLEDEEHRRNAAGLDELSYGSHWFTAREAVNAGLVDDLAEKMPDVLRAASLHPVRRDGRDMRLDLQNAQVETSHVQLQELLLLTLMNPNICVLLLTLGMLLIYLEVNTPGAIVPGASGVLLVLLALYALHLLPISVAGALLCALSSLLLLLEGRYSTHGLLASAGVIALVFGLAGLVDGPVPQLQVEWSVALGAGLGFGGVTATLIVLGLKARRAKVKTGADAMLGWMAIAQTVLAPEGKVLVRGELWPARLTSRDSCIAAGERVKVLRAEGHMLEVAALPLGDGV